jgi:hypothetical protein
LEYLLVFLIVALSIAICISFIRTRQRNMEKDYKEHCNVPPTAMTVKYIRGIPDIDAEIEKRYSHIINNAYTKFDSCRYESFIENLEKNKHLYFEDTVRKIKNKINDPRFAKNLCSVDNDTLIYMFEKVGIIDFYFWINDDKFYLVDKHYQGIGSFEFNLDEITCFCRKEDIEQERDIHKVMNGDDHSEFMVGTVLGDGTITFNKSIFPQNIKVDEKITVVEFIFGARIHCGFFCTESYEVFKNQIPRKELNFILNNIQTKPIGSIIVGMKELRIENEEITDKINKLIELKDYGLFTDFEFEEKKKIIMEKIKQ